MGTVREVMNNQVQCVNEHTNLQEAAAKMRDLDVGVLPICGDDEKLKGVVTDRDIVLRCVAAGEDPAAVEVGALAQGRPVMVDANDSVESALAAMEDNQVRRVLVLEDRRLVGIVSQRDLSRAIDPARLGQVAAAVVGDGTTSGTPMPSATASSMSSGSSSGTPTPADVAAMAKQAQSQQGLAGR